MTQSQYVSLFTLLAALLAAPLSAAEERPRMLSEDELGASIERQKKQALSQMKSQLRAKLRDPAQAEAALRDLYECLGREPSRLADTHEESPQAEPPAVRRGAPQRFRFPTLDTGLFIGSGLR